MDQDLRIAIAIANANAFAQLPINKTPRERVVLARVFLSINLHIDDLNVKPLRSGTVWRFQ